MKAMDKILRRWRISVALREAPAPLRAAFDIGCDDGFLLSRLGPETVRRDGCDPLLGSAPITPGLRLIKGHFPDALDGSFQDSSYNAIFALRCWSIFRRASAEIFRGACGNACARRENSSPRSRTRSSIPSSMS